MAENERRPDAPHLSRSPLEIRTSAAARVLLALAVPLAVLWTGSAEQEALLALGVLGVVAWGLALPHRPYRHITNPFAWVWFALGLWSLLTLVPLPRAVVAALHANAVAVSDGSRAALGLPARELLPLAIDVGAAAFQSALYLIAAALALTGGVLLAYGEGRRQAARAVRVFVALPLLTALVWQVGWGAWSIELVPEGLRQLMRHFAPVNPNHVAGLLTLGLGIALGARAHSAIEPERAAWTRVAVLYAVFVAITPSRAGFFGALFVFALAGIRVPAARKHLRVDESMVARRKQIRRILQVLVVLMVAGTLALPMLEREFGRTLHVESLAELPARDGKLDAFVRIWPHVLDGWALGQGAGSLPVTVLQQDPELSVRLEFAENILLDRIIGQGLPATIVFVVAIGFLLWTSLRRWKAVGVHQGLLIGLCGVLLHEAVDFSLELGGGLVPFLAIATLLDRERPASWLHGIEERPQLPGKRASTVASAVALVAGLFALSLAWNGREVDVGARLDGLDHAAMAEVVDADFASSHHAFYRLGRARIASGDVRGANAAFARALALKPTSDHARLFLVKARLDLGQPAAADLGRLITASFDLRRRAVDMALASEHGRSELIAAVVAAPALNDAVAREVDREDPAFVYAMVRALRQRYPEQRFAAEALLGKLYVRGKQYDQARIVAAALLGDPSTEAGGLELLGLLAAFEGNHKRAHHLYREVCDRRPQQLDACELAMRHALQGKSPGEALNYIRSQFSNLRQSAEGSRLYWSLLAHAYLALGQADDALGAARRALGYGRDNPEALGLVVRAQLRAGNWRGAQAVVDKMRDSGVDPSLVSGLADEVSATRSRR